MNIRKRMLGPAIALTIVLLGGTFGYYFLTGSKHALSDCLYMVVITLTTVGYGETIPLDGNTPARMFTIGLIFAGMGILLYLVTQLTAFFVEGDLTQALRRHKMQKMIEKMKNHIIVCGAGTAALHVVEELLATKWDIIVVDPDQTRINRMLTETEPLRPNDEIIPFILGDPTDDRTLNQARIDSAYGVLAAMDDDPENLFITVTARQLTDNPHLRIIAKAIDKRSIPKLKAAGADSVVSPHLIGGMRLASEMIRPSVVTFLDIMLRGKDENLRVAEICIGTAPQFVGQSIQSLHLRDNHDLLILAVQEANNGEYIYKPRSSFVLQENMTLIVLGGADSVKKLRDQLADYQSADFQPVLGSVKS